MFNIKGRFRFDAQAWEIPLLKNTERKGKKIPKASEHTEPALAVYRGIS